MRKTAAFVFLILTIPLSSFANSKSIKKTGSAAPKGKQVKTCESARQELDAIFKTVPSEPKFKLPAKWSEDGRVEFDFDGDQKTDAAVLLKRDFEPVFDSEETMKQALSKSEDSSEPDKRVPAFLVVWLSNKGTPKVLLPKGATFSEATSTFEVDIEMGMGKTGTGVLETHEATMMSMGGWSATSETKKWRLDSGDFRLIGRTRKTSQRNTGESEEIDENLLTGKSVVTKESLADPEDSSENPKTKKTTKTKKNSPSKIFLTTDGECNSESVTMKVGD